MLSSALPLISIANAYSNEITDRYYDENSYENDYPKDDYAGYKNELIKKFELPKYWDRPTDNEPWTQQSVPADFPLRDLCLDGKQIPQKYITKFDIEAIEVDIVYNSAGFHDADGRIYVLSEDKDKILNKVAANPGKTVTEVQPLTIRTNVGKCVEINFKNDLKEESASIHPTGIGLDPNTSDGTFVGFNDDSTVLPNETITYRWFPDVQGAHFFTDASRQIVLQNPMILGDWVGTNQTSLRQHGLFGTLVVEPRGATWTDPFTGEFLKSGVQADIHYPPGDWKQDTRERVVYYHDEAGIEDPNGNEPRGPNGEATGMYTMNYRGDTIDSRTNPEFWPENCQPGVDPAVCADPDFFYNSWVHGDPGNGDLVFPVYSGDPVRFIVVGAQTEENHVHHLHEHRWHADPAFPGGGSPTIDVQTTAPGNEYLEPVNLGFGDGTVHPDTTFAFATIAGSAGYQTGAEDDEHFTGDVIFHCHLFPHYGLGMWSLMRVMDRMTSPYPEIIPDAARDGSGGNALQPTEKVLLPLPDSNDYTYEATYDLPGFPYFIESNDDGSPKRPPNQQNADNSTWGREYTELEWKSTNYYQRAIANGDPNPTPLEYAEPGAPYDDPCPPDAPPRPYEVVAISKDIEYNKYGHHDPDGRIYVLKDQWEAIKNGDIRPEPLVLRAELGDCIEITMTNRLTPPAGFVDQTNNLSTTLSMHPHFVGFDVLGSDGVTVGYDYHQANKIGETISYRHYADEQGNIFWHDHISGIEKGMHGTGGITIIEPANSRWLDPETGQELLCPDNCPTPTEIMVVPEVEGAFEPFREFMMFYADFQELFDRYGNPIMMQAPNLADIDETNHADDPDALDRLNLNAHEPASLHDHGVMSINYRNEPLWERINATLLPETDPNHNPIPFAKDPAYLLSSNAHGDPSTHIFKAYSNEPIKIRLLAQSHEEMHSFGLNGLHSQGMDEKFAPPWLGLQAQTISAAEQFNFDFIAPTAVMERNDYMYGSNPTNDIFNGMWGLIRIWCNPNSLSEDPQFGNGKVKLVPLPGIEQVKCASDPVNAFVDDGNNDNNNVNSNLFDNDENNNNPIQGNNLQIGSNAIDIGTSAINSDADSAAIGTTPVAAVIDEHANIQQVSQQQQKQDKQLLQQKEQPAFKQQSLEQEQNNNKRNSIVQYQVLGEPLADENPVDREVLIPMDRLQELLGADPQFQPEVPQRQIQQLDQQFGRITTLEPPAPPTAIQPVPLKDIIGDFSSCDPFAKQRIFDVVAIQKDIILNDDQDKIPHGIIFVLKEDLNAIMSGEKPLEPFVIRANVGDCVVINLENNLHSESMPSHDHPLQPGECNEHVVVACLDPNAWPTSKRVSLHSDNLFYDMSAFDGANIGFNLIEQTIAPGEKITYTWQAAKTGTNVLTDFGDVRGHRHHGAYGMAIIEPEDAKYLDINTGEPIKSGAAADIVFPNSDRPDYREFALTLGDTHYITTKDDPETCILKEEEPAAEPPIPEPPGPPEPPEPVTTVGCNQDPVDDPEDQGFPTINYRSEPFVHRLIEAGELAELAGPPSNATDGPIVTSQILSQVMSSRVHGDPDTPILKVTEGTPLVLRVANVGDSARTFSFHIAGHLFERPGPLTIAESDIPEDATFQPFIERGTAQAMSTGRSITLEAVGGAGGLQDKPGDYVYQDMKLAKYVEGGAWGILRVMPADFDPMKAIKYLEKEISYSNQLSKTSKDKLVANLHHGFNLLTDEIKGNDKDFCGYIIPTLLNHLDEVEKSYKEYNKQYYESQNYKDNNYQNVGYLNYGTTASNTYGENDYKYNNNHNYGDQTEYNSEYNYGKNDYKYKLKEIEKFKELIRNIAYTLCP